MPDQEFTVRFDLGKDTAFLDDPDREVVSVLEKVIEKVKREGVSGHAHSILDSNGNRIGQWKTREVWT